MSATVPPIAAPSPAPEADVVPQRSPDPASIAEARARISARSPLGREASDAPVVPPAPAPAEPVAPPPSTPASNSLPELEDPEAANDPELAEIPKSQRAAFAKAYRQILEEPELKSVLALKVAEMSARAPAEPRADQNGAAPKADAALRAELDEMRQEVRAQKAATIVAAFKQEHPDFATDKALQAEVLSIIKTDRVPLERAYTIARAERIVRAQTAANKQVPAPPERQTAGGAPTGEMTLEALSAKLADPKQFKRTEDAVAFAFREAQRLGLPLT